MSNMEISKEYVLQKLEDAYFELRALQVSCETIEYNWMTKDSIATAIQSVTHAIEKTKKIRKINCK